MMTRVRYNRWLCALLIVGGFGMAIAGFIVPPTGEISPSVLIFSAQCFAFAGSAVGLDVLLDCKLINMRKKDNGAD